MIQFSYYFGVIRFACKFQKHPRSGHNELGCGGRIRTGDLQVMSLMRYHSSTPRPIEPGGYHISNSKSSSKINKIYLAGLAVWKVETSDKTAEDAILPIDLYNPGFSEDSTMQRFSGENNMLRRDKLKSYPLKIPPIFALKCTRDISSCGLVLVSLLLLGRSHVRAETPESPFGVGTPITENMLPGIQGIRIRLDNNSLGNWSDIEISRGLLDFRKSEQTIPKGRKYHGKSLVVIGNSPKWVSSNPNRPPRNLQDFGTFVRTLVNRYRNQVSHWQIWDGPNNLSNFDGTASMYCDVLKTAYVAVKQADPNARVVFGGLDGVDLRFVEGCYEQGIRDYFDIMAVNLITDSGDFDDSVVEDMDQLHELMLNNGDDKEIWITDVWTRQTGSTEEDQAIYLAQSLVTTLALKPKHVSKYFWRSFVDTNGSDEGLVRQDGSRKPAYEAYETVLNHLSDTRITGTFDLGQGVRNYLFHRKDKNILVLWSEDNQARSAVVPIFAKSVKAHSIDGTFRTLTFSGDRPSMDIGSSPTIIEGIGDGATKYIAALSTETVVIQPRRENYVSDVWFSLEQPETTRRHWIKKGQTQIIPIFVKNDSTKTVQGNMDVSFQDDVLSQPFRVQPGNEQRLQFAMECREDTHEGVHTVFVSGELYDGKMIFPINGNIRVTNGSSIEFLPNSYEERLYLFEVGTSMALSSRRSGGTWIYRFDLTGVGSASLAVDMLTKSDGSCFVNGSGNSQEWTELVEETKASGWQSINLDRFIGGDVFIQFVGNQFELQELILTTWK